MDGTTSSTLWTPTRVGRLDLAHRLAMAPMTRSRATPQGVPTEQNARYYAQRASIGLIVSEGTQPSAEGQGYTLTPGLHDDAQVAGWRLVTDAVHAAGGHLFVQLMHTGRVGHQDNSPDGHQPVGPSAVAAEAQIFTPTGLQAMPEPRALSLDGIAATIEDYRRSAALALAAGADGVEIHAANGYLPHQFLSTGANRRTDGYGGSTAARSRFAVEVAAAVSAEIGADRTGIRISPGNTMNGITEQDVHATYADLVGRLAGLDLAYLHVVHAGDEELLAALRAAWPTALVLNRGGQAPEHLADDVDAGLADVMSVGALALANPDLVERLRRRAPLNEPNPSAYFGGTEVGYTDYPTLGQAA